MIEFTTEKLQVPDAGVFQASHQQVYVLAIPGLLPGPSDLPFVEKIADGPDRERAFQNARCITPANVTLQELRALIHGSSRKTVDQQGHRVFIQELDSGHVPVSTN